MGFFSKVFKSVGKVFKKIGKGIKSAFKKFGKFMNKIGILGQVAMMFILPGIGNAILGTAGTAATVAGVGGATVTAAAVPASGLLGGALGSVGVAAGKAAVWVGNKIATVKNVFSNITSGVVDTLGNFAKTATNKLANSIGMDNVFTDAAKNFFGTDSAFSRSFGKGSKFQSLTTDFSKLDAVDETTNVGTEKISTEKALSAPEGAEGFKTVSYEDVSKPKYDVTTALSPDEISKINSMSSENFKSLGFKTTGEVGDIAYKFGDNEMFINTDSLSKLGETGLDKILEPFQTGEEYQKQSLLARATDTIVAGVKSIPEKGIQEAEETIDQIQDENEQLQQSLENAALCADISFNHKSKKGTKLFAKPSLKSNKIADVKSGADLLYVSDSSSQKKWSFVLLKNGKKCNPGYIQKQFISKKDEVIKKAPKEVKADLISITKPSWSKKEKLIVVSASGFITIKGFVDSDKIDQIIVNEKERQINNDDTFSFNIRVKDTGTEVRIVGNKKGVTKKTITFQIKVK